MDGRIVKDDTVGHGGCSSALGTGTAPSSVQSEGFHSSCFCGVDDRSRESGDRGLEEPNSLELGKARKGACLLERDRSYVHSATLFLFTHVVHGCLASHFCVQNQPSHFLSLARDMRSLTFFFCLITSGPISSIQPLEITTAATHRQGVHAWPISKVLPAPLFFTGV